MAVTRPIRLAFWMPKGGVGKTTDTLLVSLLAARRGQRVLAVDVDPEAGLSRDVLGPTLPKVTRNLKTFLEAKAPGPPPVLPTTFENLSVLPCPPGEHRFFRLFEEHS
jgi:cellulose biosynthesis protein BcsQ